jgi:hypothetical protein
MREVAWRIFAAEFNRATFQYSEGGEKATNFVVTHTGARCNRLFIVGILNQVEKVAENSFRASVSDPTGNFVLHVGQYQPGAAMFLSDIETPQFVSVVGKAKVGAVRPEEMNLAVEAARNRWTLNTAERTMERVDAMKIAVEAELRGEELERSLAEQNIDANLSKGISLAIENYDINETLLDEIAKMCMDATKTLTGDENSKTVMLGLVEHLDCGKGVSRKELLKEAKKAGLANEKAECALDALLDEGRCYEPKVGAIKKV